MDDLSLLHNNMCLSPQDNSNFYAYVHLYTRPYIQVSPCRDKFIMLTPFFMSKWLQILLLSTGTRHQVM